MRVKNGEFIYKNIPLTKIRELVLEDQMKIAVDLRNKNFVSLQKRVYSFFRSENSRVFSIYKSISEKGLSFSSHSRLIDDTVSKLWSIVKKPNLYKTIPTKRNLSQKFNKSIQSRNIVDISLQFLYKMVLEVILEEISDPNVFSCKYFRSPGWAVKSVDMIFKDTKISNFKKYLLKLDFSEILIIDSILYDWILQNLSIYKVFNFDLVLIPKNIISQWRAKRYRFYVNKY